MVRPEVVERLQRPVRANSSDGFSRSSASSNSSESAKSAKKLSAAGVKQVMSETMNSHGGEKQQRSIVKEQFRLPRDLMEKMPSASNSPVMGRKSSSGVESSENSESKGVKKVPLSVASMVRRFETSNPSKTRGGSSDRSVTSEMNLMSERSQSQKINNSESSLSSSPSSSQGHLNETQTSEVPTNLGSNKSESSSEKKQITTKTNQNKTVKSMSTGIVARAKSALENEQKSPSSSSSVTGPILTQNTSSTTNKKASSSKPSTTPLSSKTTTPKTRHTPHEGQSQSSPITRPTSRRVTSGRVSSERVNKSSVNERPKTATPSTSRVTTKTSTSERVTPANSRVTKSSTSERVMGNCAGKKSTTGGATKKPSKTSVTTGATSKPSITEASKKLSRPEVLKEDKKRDDSPSSTLVNVSSDSSVSPPPPSEKNETKLAARRDTRDMVSPISSPNMSDISDTEENDYQQKSKVKLRSESDGIVVKSNREKPPVRRCESTDDATDRLVPISEEMVPAGPPEVPDNHNLSFPQNIKTVASATIVKGPEDITHKIGDTCHFAAHYFGNPEPRVIWIKNGQQLKQDLDARISIKTYSGESSLIVRDLRGDDSGKYEIQIENEVGNDAATASLTVYGPPEPPANRPFVSLIDAENSSLTLAWYGSTFDGGSILTGYIVEMSSWPITSSADPPDASDWQVLNDETLLSTSFVVKGLKKDKEYIFRVKAVNSQGHSEPSKVSEPVSLASHQHSGASEEEETEEVNENDNEEIVLDKDPFEAPFEHRIVTVEEGSIFKSKYEIFEELGRGRFGVVFKVKDKGNGEILAAKFVRCRKQEEKQKCKDEIAIMNILESSKLLQLAAAYENPREMIMLMEYIGGGELFEKVVAEDFVLTERDCILFMRQICEAVGFMHEKNIVHLDLKPENILCKSKKSHLIKIIDFGLTKKLKPGEDVRILFGTPEFVSPEVISYEPVSTTSDMWSVGVICYVLLSGLSPFMGDSDVETFANISGIAYDFDDEAFDNISEEAKDFISKLLVKFQNKRLTAKSALLHPWLLASATHGQKEINTDKLKSFLMRRRWQKAAHAIRALGRFTSLNKDAKDSGSTITALSTQSANF